MPREERARLFSPNARSLPHRRAFVWAGLLVVLCWLLTLGALTLGYLMLARGRAEVLPWFIATAVAVLLVWTIGYLVRRAARCPLCQGTPLLDNPAAKHRKALRLPPLNHGGTAVLHLLLTHRFRCMYCGTPFDLLRKHDRRAAGRDAH